MNAPAPARGANVRFLLRHPAHFIALGAGSGLSPVAPGTAGTLWAWLCFDVLGPHVPARDWAWILLGGLAVGWWACTRAAQGLGTPDPSPVVWDEIIAFWLVLVVIAPSGFATQCAAFVLFRFFDAAKPGPVGWADRLYKAADSQTMSVGWREGWGIIFDDLVAAACALFCMALWKWFWA